METKYKAIALDMDGTVLNSKKQMTPATVAAIHKALAAGKHVVFCTGRSYAEMRDILKAFPDMEYLLGESGGLLYDLMKHEVLYKAVIPTEVIAMLKKTVEGRDICPNAFCGGETYFCEDKIYRLDHYEMAPYKDTMPKVGTIVKDVFETIETENLTVEKLNLYHTNIEERAKSKAMLEAMNPDAELVDSEISSLECSPRGIGKGNGIRMFAEIVGIDPSEIIMVGDADNDLDGMRAAGLAVAMGNANENVKAASDVMVADNDHDGCAEAIEKYLLGE